MRMLRRSGEQGLNGSLLWFLIIGMDSLSPFRLEPSRLLQGNAMARRKRLPDDRPDKRFAEQIKEGESEELADAVDNAVPPNDDGSGSERLVAETA